MGSVCIEGNLSLTAHISPSVESDNFPLIYLPHLYNSVRVVLDFALFSKLVWPTYALYVIYIRQTESLN